MSCHCYVISLCCVVLPYDGGGRPVDGERDGGFEGGGEGLVRLEHTLQQVRDELAWGGGVRERGMRERGGGLEGGG